jgi:outer membrane protein OmpA-like peptidoglycan-associated protein
MIDVDIERESSHGVNIWISFADLFAGLLLVIILGLVLILPHYRAVRFSRELAAAMNQATETTRLIQDRLQRSLPSCLEQPSYSETEIVIPSAALFRSYGFDDYLYDEQKRGCLSAIGNAIKEALNEAKDRRRFLRVVIEGHTDSDPIKKEAVTRAIPTNWELSSRRATGVLRFFEDGGLNAGEYNVVAMGFADTVPVADNTTDKGKAKNRRIVIRIEPDLEAIKANLSGH